MGDDNSVKGCCHESLLGFHPVDTVIPDICHGRHGRRPCKLFLPGVNFSQSILHKGMLFVIYTMYNIKYV